ncbi:TetR/AcrR family transcriptional regulator [Mycolicibacterium komossense]|uniref:TetR/AcrR family transcriptional regulator n=1 Tax=Mycolicibacterium komossense TaxID=1779 RepID=A0ABT3C4Z4_9MYCO|nr:TetR/AcrR family transcriptional regulator [Mycolicibacterium komossense]MCV7224515.1 TetR/AcrR family transcriptional regulator [Mycolicibacterium komossense]
MPAPAHVSAVPRQRRWATTDATQQRILDAAIEVFRERGYTVATIGDVVTASGASIGSIYHHFGGKAELFLAIHERMAVDVELRIAEVAAAAAAADSFEAQFRAYLDAVWVNRQTAKVLAADDIPPGFDRIRRDDMLTRFREWVSVLDIGIPAADGDSLLVRILIGVLSESAGMVMDCDDAAEVLPVVDAAIGYINRLIS